jgi:four helix bundle protein
VIDSATSVGSNYRAACRARSHKEFVAKIGTVIEEADESNFWLDLLITLGHCTTAAELTAIFVASSNTAHSR